MTGDRPRDVLDEDGGVAAILSAMPALDPIGDPDTTAGDRRGGTNPPRPGLKAVPDETSDAPPAPRKARSTTRTRAAAADRTATAPAPRARLGRQNVLLTPEALAILRAEATRQSMTYTDVVRQRLSRHDEDSLADLFADCRPAGTGPWAVPRLSRTKSPTGPRTQLLLLLRPDEVALLDELIAKTHAPSRSEFITRVLLAPPTD